MFNSIKKNSEFLNVYRHGKSYANKYLVMYVLENELNDNRFGITVSKKVGNSVVRHRVTRLIRESIRLNEEKFARGYDIVIIARNTAKGKNYNNIVILHKPFQYFLLRTYTDYNFGIYNLHLHLLFGFYCLCEYYYC